MLMEEILPQARVVTVQVAHLGGPGTFYKVTSHVASAFAKQLAAKPTEFNNLYFDLAAFPINPQKERKEKQKIAYRL